MFNHKIAKMALLTVGILLLGAVGLSYFEETATFRDALWWSFVTITTVGYGDVTPTSIGGRVTGVIVMVFGIGMLGMFTATVASIFVEGKLSEGKGKKKVKVSGHFLICGWSYKVAEVVAEMRADQKVAARPIVLIADLPEKPLEDDNLFFVAGEVNTDTLEKACLCAAESVLMISPDGLDAHSCDARVVFNTLAVRTLNKTVYICAEISEVKNKQHCEMAGANEIIVIGDLSSNLLVQAALDHGITHMISELVTNRSGSSLFKVKPPAALIGVSFITALDVMKRDFNAITLAVESKNDARFVSNPEKDYLLREDDLLVVVSEKRPMPVG